MKIQNSLLESQLKTPKEAPLRSALWGNQLRPPIEVRHRTIYKPMIGRQGFNWSYLAIFGKSYEAPAGHPLPSSPYEWARWAVETHYMEQTDRLLQPSDIWTPYTGTTVANQYGYPATIQGYPNRTGAIPWDIAFPQPAPGQFGNFFPYLYVSDTEIQERFSDPTYYYFNKTLGGPRSTTPDWGSGFMWFDTHPWQAWPIGWQLHVKEVGANYNYYIPIANPQSYYDGTDQLFAYEFPPSAFVDLTDTRNVHVVNGWRMDFGGSLITIQKGQARLPLTAAPQQYWIGHRIVTGYGGSFFSGDQLTQQLTLIGSGILYPGQTIGDEADIPVDFPEPALPLRTISAGVTMPITEESYFVVVGMDPFDWVVQPGFTPTKFGDTVVSYP